MREIKNLLIMFILISPTLWFYSCNNDGDNNLIDSSFKNVVVSCGSDFEIPVTTNNWIIESVQDISSTMMLTDKNNNLLQLGGRGEIEASNGWLVLIRENDDSFTIRLKENFDEKSERKFIICINNSRNKDYITFTQKAGTAYKIVKAEFEEREKSREIYISDKEYVSMTISNTSSEEVWKPTGLIFGNVIETSILESSDCGAFDWIQSNEININTPNLIIGGKSYWDDVSTYKQGIITKPYLNNINDIEILIKPYSTCLLKGKVTYCKRICDYTLTIENAETGTEFTIKGVWTQIVPISTYLTAS